MNLNNGIQHLKKSDKLLKEIINQYPAPSIKKSHNYFQSLIKYIIYQQLSTKSASVIYDRFIKSFDTARLTPDHIFSITKEELKLIGLSRQKKQYIFLLAENWSKTKNKLKNIELCITPKGGHLGFLNHSFSYFRWMDECILNWLKHLK